MRIVNVHQRRLPVPAARLAPLLDGLAGPDDRLWPHGQWPSMRFDRPLAIGAAGGHGAVRYRVTAYQPGRRVAFTFAHRGLSRGLDGGHRFEIEDAGADAAVMRHVVDAEMRGRGLVRWLLVIRWLHDAVVEDALDNAERAVTGSVARPARWSPWVRLWRRLMRRSPVLASRPAGAGTSQA